MFSAEHEPTKKNAFGEGLKCTESSAFGVVHEPTKDSDFEERREPTQTDPQDRQGDRSFKRGWGLSTSQG